MYFIVCDFFNMLSVVNPSFSKGISTVHTLFSSLTIKFIHINGTEEVVQKGFQSHVAAQRLNSAQESLNGLQGTKFVFYII